MKNKLSRPLLIVLAFFLVLSTVVFAVTAAGADPAAIYNGTTGTVEFENAIPFIGNTEPDLFPNMKDMMPGDSVSQAIEIGAKRMTGFTYVRLFLRAENPNADYVKLMETYGHWVDFTVRYQNEVITGDLANGVLLGTFFSNERRTVDVTLSIDLEAGNELQDLIAEIDWVFIAETFAVPLPPIEPDETDPPVLPEPDVDVTDLPWLTTEHVNYIIGYDDGLVRPGDTITRAEVVTIFYRLLTEEARHAIWSDKNIYPDVDEDDWFYIAVCTLTNGGLIEGYPDGTFQPNDPITRAELAAIICRFDIKYGEIEITKGFEDAEGHWAQAYVEHAATRGYVLGYPDGTFRPDKPISRAETVTMVNRCLDRAVDEEGLIEGYVTWSDNLPAEWYYFEIIEAANYHDFTRSERPVDQQDYCYEDWFVIESPIDWQRHEQQWLKELVRK